MIQVSKQDLRKEFLRKRKALTEQKVEGFSKKIHDWFFRNIPAHAYATIHTFLPIKRNNEIDTWLIINTLQKDFATNIVIPKSHEDGTMTNYLLTKETFFEENQWKIPEPSSVDSIQSSVADIDLVLIPLLCFDKKGYRVGYGKGYYDRFLANCRPDVLKIGLSIFEPIEQIKDVDAYDIRLDFCITPNKIWQFS